MNRSISATIVVAASVAALVSVQADARPVTVVHVVAESSDSWSTLGSQCGSTAAAVRTANGLASNAAVPVGGVLHCPPAGEETPTTQAPATAPAPTTLPSTTTTQPPTGTAFTESFETASGFYDRFVLGMSGFHPAGDPNHITHWAGDHNMDCGSPDTKRDVNLGADKAHLSELFWHCAPGGDPAKGHIMTSLNVLGYVYLWFSPNRWFSNVSQVCWDQNLTMLGGRKWTEMEIISRADVERIVAQEGHLDLGFSDPGFQTIGGPTTGIIPSDGVVGVGYSIGQMRLWQGDVELGSTDGTWKTEDLAFRGRLCATDNGNNTISISLNRPDGTQVSKTLAGAFPDGDVMVSFVDANYDPPKDSEYDSNQNTWHWDNISIQ